jgi:tetratricopeptide (TPR) repeat protein
MYHRWLRSFTEEETEEYLKKRGIVDLTKIKTFWQLSHGLPLYLSMQTSSPTEIDPTASVVENFLRWIPKQEQVKRNLALDAALFSKSFNLDDLQVFDYLPRSENERFALYRWLTSQPFVTVNEHGGYFYHEIAQTLFSRHLYQKSPQGYYATRKKLAEYYSQKIAKWQAEGDQRLLLLNERADLVFALAEQLMLLPDEADHLQAIEHILDSYEYVVASAEAIEKLHQLIQKVLDLQAATYQKTDKLIEVFKGYVEASTLPQSEDALEATNNFIEEATHYPSFPEKSLASIFYRRSVFYQNVGYYEKALEDSIKAIHLDPGKATYYNNRGSVYYDLTAYADAIADFQKALQLDANIDSAYKGLSLAKRMLQAPS